MFGCVCYIQKRFSLEKHSGKILNHKHFNKRLLYLSQAPDLLMHLAPHLPHTGESKPGGKSHRHNEHWMHLIGMTLLRLIISKSFLLQFPLRDIKGLM